MDRKDNTKSHNKNLYITFKRYSQKFLINEDSYYAKEFENKHVRHIPYQSKFSSQRNNKLFKQKTKDIKTQKNSVADYSSSALESRIFDGDEVSAGIDFDSYEAIPVEISGRSAPARIESFENIDNVHPQLLWNISRSGYTRPTPVQKHAVAMAVAGRDVMGVAQTGSGKTAAYLLPLIQMLLETGGGEAHSSYGLPARPIALVLLPTRELATQVVGQVRKFAYRTGLRHGAVYGGVPLDKQRSWLRHGVDILVATPGRLLDFLRREEVELMRLRFLVLDEADRMLDMGFEEQISEIMHEKFGMPPARGRQTLMFSATFPRSIQYLARRFLDDYLFFSVGKVGGASGAIRQEVAYAETNDKPSMLLDFVDSMEGGSVLIFVQKRVSARKIEV